YYRTKRQVENLVERSGLPFSIVRATQFHDLVLYRIIRPADHGDGTPIHIPSGLVFQSVDTSEVAKAIATLTQSGPSREIETLAGPERLTIEAMTRQYLEVQGRRTVIVSVATTNPFHDVFRSGVNVSDEWPTATVTWRSFLEQVSLP